MPLVEIKVFEDELSDRETLALITGVTDSMVSVSGEALRPYTWVIVNQVRSGSWGIGGDALGLNDVRALQGRLIRQPLIQREPGVASGGCS